MEIKEALNRCLAVTAGNMPEFTHDDVLELFDRNYPEFSRERGVLPYLSLHFDALNEGAIENSGKPKVPSRLYNGLMLNVYKSNIYQGLDKKSVPWYHRIYNIFRG